MNQRAQYLPPKKKTAPAYLMGLLLVIAAGMCVVVYIRYQDREKSKKQPRRVVTEEFNPIDELKPDMQRADKLYFEAAALKNDDERTEEYNRKTNEAIDAYSDLLEKLDATFAKHRDPETGRFLPGYEGYQKYYTDIQRKQNDLTKISGFGF